MKIILPYLVCIFLSNLTIAQINDFNRIISNVEFLNEKTFTQSVLNDTLINLIEKRSRRLVSPEEVIFISDTYTYEADQEIKFIDRAYNFSFGAVTNPLTRTTEYGDTIIVTSVWIGNPFAAAATTRKETYQEADNAPYTLSRNYRVEMTGLKLFNKTVMFFEDSTLQIISDEFLNNSGQLSTKNEYIIQGNMVIRNYYNMNGTELKSRVTVVMNEVFQMPELIFEEHLENDIWETDAMRIGEYDADNLTGIMVRKDPSNLTQTIDSFNYKFTEYLAISERDFFKLNDDLNFELLSCLKYNNDEVRMLRESVSFLDFDTNELIEFDKYIYEERMEDVSDISNALGDEIKLVVPNPAAQSDAIRILTRNNDEYEFIITGLDGELFFMDRFKGDQILDIQNFNLNTGIYFYTLSSRGVSRTDKIIVL